MNLNLQHKFNLSALILKRYSSRKVRIGCASGFWGDTATAVPQLVYGGKLQYLVFDYLAEITMSLLTAAKAKFPNMGYAPDFVHFAMKPFLGEIKNQGIKVISNAGGINPMACAKALKDVAKDAGVDLKIAVVTGDNLYEKVDQYSKLGIIDMNSGAQFPPTITSMNAYLGCDGIVKALQKGADIVITGRCVDSAVTLGPLVYEFGWKMDDWNKLAAGSLAGHIIECGAQCTGGISTSWQSVSGWDNMGFPVVECQDNGSFTLNKPPKTGGAINFANVAEQLVYEIGDPRAYLLPDVMCDLSNVTIKDLGGNSVVIEGAKGRPPTNHYKVCATYKDGYRISIASPVIGPKAIEKARVTADAVLKRSQRILNFLGMEDFKRTHIEMLGSGHNYGPNATNSEKETREVVMFVAAHHEEKRALELMAREISASGTGATPGLTGLAGGRPKVSPVLRLFTFLIPKDEVKVKVQVDEGQTEELTAVNTSQLADEGEVDEKRMDDLKEGSQEYRLHDLAYTRSGDKGNNANIGVIAREPRYYPYLKKHLTAEVMANYFEYLFEEPDKAQANLTRYLLPGVNGLNFVLKDALGGGGVSSLRSDPQGKALGQISLDLKLRNLPKLEDM